MQEKMLQRLSMSPDSNTFQVSRAHTNAIEVPYSNVHTFQAQILNCKAYKMSYSHANKMPYSNAFKVPDPNVPFLPPFKLLTS